jgi:hypothetical protein
MEDERPLRADRVLGVAVRENQHLVARRDRLDAGDLGRADRADDELDALADELIGAGGRALGGVFRVEADDAYFAGLVADLDAARGVGLGGGERCRAFHREPPLRGRAREGTHGAELHLAGRLSGADHPDAEQRRRRQRVPRIPLHPLGSRC